MSFQTCNTLHLQNTNSDVFDEIQGLSDSDSKATEMLCYLPCLQAEEHMVPLGMAVDWPGREVIVKKNFCLHTKSILVASLHYGWTTDVTWTILSMSLLPFWALNVVVALLFMQGQKNLKFHHFGFLRVEIIKVCELGLKLGMPKAQQCYMSTRLSAPMLPMFFIFVMTGKKSG